MFCKYYLASKSNICKILKYQLQTKKFSSLYFYFFKHSTKVLFYSTKAIIILTKPLFIATVAQPSSPHFRHYQLLILKQGLIALIFSNTCYSNLLPTYQPYS